MVDNNKLVCALVLRVFKVVTIPGKGAGQRGLPASSALGEQNTVLWDTTTRYSLEETLEYVSTALKHMPMQKIP